LIERAERGICANPAINYYSRLAAKIEQDLRDAICCQIADRNRTGFAHTIIDSRLTAKAEQGLHDSIVSSLTAI